MEIELGYCCISVLHEKLRCNRSSTKTYLERMNVADRRNYLIDKANENLNDLRKLLWENKRKEILAYRLPEQILPQIDLEYYSIEDIRDSLEHVGRIANEYGILLSNHPSQYFVLNSLRKEVVDKTVSSLNIFGDTLSAMKLDHTAPLVLHVGVKNGYESKEHAIDAFCENFERLNEASKKHLVVENDHISFNVEDCLKIHDQVGIPVVFDNMHYKWNPGDLDFEEAVAGAVATWGSRIPKMHLASDKEGSRHAHSDFIILEDYRKLEQALQKTETEKCCFMLECKRKDEAVLKLREDIKSGLGD